MWGLLQIRGASMESFHVGLVPQIRVCFTKRGLFYIKGLVSHQGVCFTSRGLFYIRGSVLSLIGLTNKVFGPVEAHDR